MPPSIKMRNLTQKLIGQKCVKHASKKIQPVRFRTKPLQRGERVYVLGWRYTEKDCPQIVYEGEYLSAVTASRSFQSARLA